MSVIHTPRRPEVDVRMLLFPILFLCLALVLVFRLWYFQVVKVEDLRERAEYFGRVPVKKPAPRGLIFDRKGRLLAGVRSQIVVTAVPATVKKNPWVLDKLATMVGTDRVKLREKVEDGVWRPYIPVPVAMGVTVEIAARIAESGENLPGIRVESQPIRDYTDSLTFSHLLGYIWTPSERDVARLTDQGLEPAEFVGKTAIEQVYEKELMGSPGQELLEVDAKRRPIRVIGRSEAVPGSRLILTIDADLQRYALQLLRGRRGAIVAMDPSNGDILALASSPTYDAGLFRNGISRADFARLNEDPANPLINRTIQGSYQPGSTFKIATALIAMGNGMFDAYRTVDCRGGYELGDRTFRCMGRHGRISFQRALEKSCNTYFADMAYRLGKVKMQEGCLALGFNQRTGIDLPYERRGNIPTDEWMERVAKRPWYGGDTVQMGFGQGAVETTPIQMATFLSMVANDGVGYRPRLVRAIRGANDRQQRQLQPVVGHRLELDPAEIQIVKSALERVVESGTAAGSRIANLRWAGKTGSAEHRRGAKTHSWFVAYAPAVQPKIVVCAIVEAAGHGNEVAVPVVRDVVQRYLFGSSINPESRAVSNVASAESASAARFASPTSR